MPFQSPIRPTPSGPSARARNPPITAVGTNSARRCLDHFRITAAPRKTSASRTIDCPTSAAVHIRTTLRAGQSVVAIRRGPSQGVVCPLAPGMFVVTGENTLRRRADMKYLLQIYPGVAPEELPADERQAMVEEYLAIERLPEVIGGERLQPIETATTVRVQDGEALLSD